jgi:hypothetical protein
MGRVRERAKRREGAEKLDGEAEAGIYICFSGFSREAGEGEEKREKPRGSGRSCYRQNLLQAIWVARSKIRRLKKIGVTWTWLPKASF